MRCRKKERAWCGPMKCCKRSIKWGLTGWLYAEDAKERKKDVHDNKKMKKVFREKKCGCTERKRSHTHWLRKAKGYTWDLGK